MGVQVATSFDTPQGFSVTSVYVRIAQVILTSLTTTPTALVFFDPVISREKRGASTLTVPAMPTSVTFQAPLSDCIRFEVLYARLQAHLEASGFVCTPVLEEGQSLPNVVEPTA